MTSTKACAWQGFKQIKKSRDGARNHVGRACELGLKLAGDLEALIKVVGKSGKLKTLMNTG